MEKKLNDLFSELITKDSRFEETITISEDIAKVVQRLIEIRVNKNLTQRQLAEISGIKQSAIARLEKMTVVPRLDTIVKLAYHLGCKLNLIEKNNANVLHQPVILTIKLEETIIDDTNINLYQFDEKEWMNCEVC